jgi:tRNA(Ile)-lysidine synthase
MTIYEEELLSAVLRVARETGMFAQAGRRVAVAVSGGADSVCLLHVLTRLAHEFGITLSVAHLNHGVRGSEADEDEQFVRHLARAAGLPFYSEKIDVPALHRPGGPSLEQLCRSERQAFYLRALVHLNAHLMALAHTRSDQAETVLLRLLRGTSARGLAAMNFVNDYIVRPLLAVSSALVRDYCRDNNLEFREDASNRDETYLRNRVRHSLLPQLESLFNSSIEERLFSLSRLIRADADYLDELANQAFVEARTESAGDEIHLSLHLLVSLNDAVLSRVLLRGYFELTRDTSATPDFGHISNLIQIVRQGRTSQEITLPKDILFVRQYDKIIFRRDTESGECAPSDYEMELPIYENIPVAVSDPYGVTIQYEIKNIKSVKPIKQRDPMLAQVDAAGLGNVLTVRNWRPGDWFIPLGMGGRKKLQDFFTDEKVPVAERNRVPILLSGENIVWIVGYRIDERFKVTQNTTKALCFKANPLEPGFQE